MHVAPHAKFAAGEIEVVPLVMHVHQLHQQLIAVDLSPTCSGTIIAK